MSSYFSNIKGFIFRPKKTVYRPLESLNPYKIILTQGCLMAVMECLKPEIDKRHEGITYLFGQTNGKTTLAVAAIRPQATTKSGSFYVSPLAMAKIVRSACNLGLQVVGQIHTHPGNAYHSEGDEEGAKLAYSGYASLVFPNYGQYLPSFRGAAIYMYQSEHRGFVELDSTDTTVIQEAL